MHFWIDKRSQCAYSGRHRVPSSLSAGRSRGRVCVGGVGAGAGGGRKGMAAPVHRFAAVDCPPRRPHRTTRHYAPPPMPAVSVSGAGAGARRRPDEPSLYVQMPAAPAPAQPTIASLAAARSVTPDTLLRTAALGLPHSPMVAPHLKFGMFVSFALATVFLAGAKYYFDRQISRERAAGGVGGAGGGGAGAGGGGEAGVVCAAVACVCGVGCALSLCRARPAPPAVPPERVSSTARRDRGAHAPAHPHPHADSARMQVGREPSDMSLSSLLQTPGDAGPGARVAGAAPGEAPPPYHIAVLLPRQGSPPPPAYSALAS